MMKRRNKSITLYQIVQKDWEIVTSFDSLTFPRLGRCSGILIDPKRVDTFMRKLEGLVKCDRRRESAFYIAIENIGSLGLRGFHLLNQFFVNGTGDLINFRLAEGYLKNEPDVGHFRRTIQKTIDWGVPNGSEAKLIFSEGLNGHDKMINRLDYRRGVKISRRDMPFGEGAVNAVIYEKGYNPYQVRFEIVHVPGDKTQFRERGVNPTDVKNTFELVLKPVF